MITSGVCYLAPYLQVAISGQLHPKYIALYSRSFLVMHSVAGKHLSIWFYRYTNTAVSVK